MPNVVIATTMWGEAKKESGERREEQLKRDFWQGMMADGCRIERFEDTYDSAWRIIGNMSQKSPGINVLIQKEMGGGDQMVKKTSAGKHADRPHVPKSSMVRLRRWFSR